VFYIRDLLQEKYGFYDIGRLGLTIKTTLDYEIQKMVEIIVLDEINKVKRLRISNGAVLVLGVKMGDVLAMVGSKDYYSKEIDGKYNVTTALRQPGSSIKPINYLLALKNGKSMMTMIDDSPITFPSDWGQKPYTPQNYNGKFMGRVTLKTALASSLNVPSVKLLAENGVNNMIDQAEAMGITTWQDRSRFGLALALGSGEVKMTEIAQAYSIFANLGKKVEINPIMSVDNYLGENLFSKEIEEKEVVEPEYAFLINNTLSDNDARTPIFGPNSKLKIANKTVAVKTGTTNNLKDNWCIGWTPSLLVAAWVGNNDSTPMSWVASGISGATPIWNRIMTEILKDKPGEKWEVPMGVYKATVCGKEDYFTNNQEENVKCPTPSVKSGNQSPVDFFNNGRQ
jgi:membrane peptidoglycan carboxypeptidase